MQKPEATGAAAPVIAETLAKLGVGDKTGLTEAEIQARLKQYGPNAFVEKQKNELQSKNSAFRMFLELYRRSAYWV